MFRSVKAQLFHWLFGTALLLATLVISNTFFARFLTAPMKRDEVEFLHSAWLMHAGARPFSDFFQHHSPLYLELVAGFVDDAYKLDWVLELRLLSALLAGASALMAGWLAVVSVRRHLVFRPSLAAFSALLFLFIVQSFPVFEIRPESVAVPFFLAAWVAHEGAIARRSLTVATLCGVLAGLAIALSPRALLPVAGLMATTLLFGMVERNNYQVKHALGAGITAVATGLGVLLALSSADDLMQWVYRFSRHSRPLSPLFDTVSVSTIAWLLLPVIPVLFFAYNRARKQSLLAPIGVLLAALLGLTLEPRQFGQSLSFIVAAVVVFHSRCLGQFFSRLHLQQQPSPIPVIITAAAFFFMLVWHMHLLSAGARVNSTPPSDAWLLESMKPGRTLLSSLQARTLFCRRHAGHRVLVEPTEFHPICLADASYYWRGAQYLRAGTLQAAGITSPRYQPVIDIERARPILLGPDFLNGATAAERAEVDRILAKDYTRSGWAFLHRDITVSDQP